MTILLTATQGAVLECGSPVVPRIGAEVSTARPESSPARPAKKCLRGLVLDSQNKVDSGALQELRMVSDKVTLAWTDGIEEVLTKRNPELLTELGRLESVLNSLLVIPNWPTPLRKQWRDTLASYEKTAMQCITYGRRHLPQSQGKTNQGEK